MNDLNVGTPGKPRAVTATGVDADAQTSTTPVRTEPKASSSRSAAFGVPTRSARLAARPRPAEAGQTPDAGPDWMAQAQMFAAAHGADLVKIHAEHAQAAPTSDSGAASGSTLGKATRSVGKFVPFVAGTIDGVDKAKAAGGNKLLGGVGGYLKSMGNAVVGGAKTFLEQGGKASPVQVLLGALGRQAETTPGVSNTTKSLVNIPGISETLKKLFVERGGQ